MCGSFLFFLSGSWLIKNGTETKAKRRQKSEASKDNFWWQKEKKTMVSQTREWRNGKNWEEERQDKVERQNKKRKSNDESVLEKYLKIKEQERDSDSY